MFSQSVYVPQQIAANIYPQGPLFSQDELIKFEEKRGKYNYVTNETRYKLVLFVEDLQMSINQACAILSLKYTTAKSILNMFKQSGRVHRMQRSSYEKQYFADIQNNPAMLKAQQMHMIQRIREHNQGLIQSLQSSSANKTT